MKQYFLLKEVSACNATNNIYPQVAVTSPSQVASKIFNKKLDFRPALTFTLEEETVLTDFISYNSSYLRAKGLLISLKVLNLLSSFKLQDELETWEVKVELNDQLFSYFWLHPTNTYNKFIDFKRTNFSLYDKLTNTTKSIQIKDTDDFNRKRLNKKAYETIRPEEEILVFTNENILATDLMLLAISNWEIFISERLKQSIENSDLTGYYIHQAPYLLSC